VVFVHGCFWHRHSCPEGRVEPKTRAEFWREKLQANVRRDRRTRRKLKSLGWDVMDIWECQVISPERVAAKLKRFLEG
jgi:DNA mismatch endonuclease (patch repair protein)